MHYLAHRGTWTKSQEQNSLESFEQSLINGFGIETDLRWYDNQLVISHDLSKMNDVSVELLLQAYLESDNKTCLALNIKEDGLQIALKTMLDQYNINNYFVFDMSIPDSLGYINLGFNVAMRLSEYETSSPLMCKVEYVWVDCFENDWGDFRLIQSLLDNNKKIIFVSPELHKRNHLSFWNKLKKSIETRGNAIMLCTDFPQQAKDFFG